MFGFWVTSLKGSFCIQLVCLSSLAYLPCIGVFSHMSGGCISTLIFPARQKLSSLPTFYTCYLGINSLPSLAWILCHIFPIYPSYQLVLKGIPLSPTSAHCPGVYLISNLPSNSSHCVSWFFLFFTRPCGQRLVFVFNSVTPALYVSWYTVGVHYTN